MATRLTAIISSTARDLPEHREEVMAACLDQEVFPKMMEYLPASDADAIQVSLRLVDEADVYIGVFAHRYGYVPKGYDLSVTEMEYNRAVERGIPRLIFLMHEDHPLKAADVEKGAGAAKLEVLKARLATERVAKFFTSSKELRTQVTNSLSHYLRQRTETLEREVNALTSAGADLLISSTQDAQRLRPLDGHPTLHHPTDGRSVFTGGFRVAFTLAHNGVGKHTILLRGIELKVINFLAGTQADYAYQLEGAQVIGAGIAVPHVFSVALFGTKIGPARWVIDAQRGQFLLAKSPNFFDTDPPRLFTFAADGSDIEEIQGTVLTQEPGFYEVAFTFSYSVAGSDRQYTTEPILLYEEE